MGLRTLARASRPALLAAALIGTLVPLAPAVRADAPGGNSMPNGIEIDGNKASDGAADWNTAPGVVQLGESTGQSDESFKGSKEFQPFGWELVTGSVPPKTDMTEAGVQLVSDQDGNDWISVYFDRKADNGSTFASFELNQSDDAFVNSKGHLVPKRTVGDLLISLFVYQGGVDTDVIIHTWADVPDDGRPPHEAGVWVPTETTDANRHITWDAATNAESDGKWTFAEATINLTHFGIDRSCPGFGKMWAHTTSSPQFDTAELKDRTDREDLDLSTCAHKDWEFTFQSQPWQGASVDAVYSVQGATEPRRLSLVDEDDGVVDGVFEASDNRVPPGTVTYHFEIFSGGQLVHSTAPAVEVLGQHERRTNTGSFDYSLSLTPERAENFAGSDHTFTATVTAADGSALAHIPVGAAITNGCGGLFPDDGSSIDDPGSSTLTGLVTNGSGQATFRVASPTTCTAAITATVTGTGATYAGESAPPPSDSAAKAFVDFRVTVSPEEAFNEADPAGSQHEFTVLVEKDSGDGDGWQPLPGVAVDLELVDNTANAQITEINGAPAVGTTGSCQTRADGTCSVVVTSTQTGSVRLAATHTSVVDGEQGTFTDSGDKTYVAYAIDVTPAGADNEVGDEHTFTVTVTRDDGNGPEPVEGAEVTLELDVANNPSATLVSINGQPASGTSGACITVAGGTCTVTINASDPGPVILTATFDTTLDDGRSEQPVTETDTAEKRYHDFSLTVSPRDAENEVGDPHTFTLRLTHDDGNGPAGLPGEVISFSLQGSPSAGITEINGEPASGTNGTCETRAEDPQTPATEAGTCLVTVVASEAGTITLDASWQDETIGTEATREASGTKRYSDFRLSLSPGSAENEVGDPHTFEVLLERDTGNGFAPFGGEPIDLTLSGDARFEDVNGALATGTSAACTTDVTGRCVVRITSDQPGAVTLTASWSTTLDEESGSGATREATADKQYLDFALTLTPGDSENFVGQDHTFTARLTRDAGEGFEGFAGQTLALSLDTTANPSAELVSVNGAPASGTAATCVTLGDDPETAEDEAGTCTIVASASQPGAVSLDATWDGQLDAGDGDTREVTRSAEPATKTWVDYDLDVFPGEATNEADPDGSDHEFLLTLSKDTGDGLAGLSGAVVEFALADNTADAVIRSINGDPADGTSGECVTLPDDPQTQADETGTCLVVVRSTQTGSVTLAASHTATNDGGTMVYPSSGDKLFSDWRLTLTPPSARNEVGAEHVFTALLERKDDETTDFQPLAGENVTFSFDAAGLQPDSAIPAPPGDSPLSCTTAADGTCTMTISSDDPGTVAATATYQTTIDTGWSEAEVERTANATKTYEAYDLTVTPENATNIVGHPHTFVVTLTRDVGDGPQPYGDQAIALAFTAGGDVLPTVETVNGDAPTAPLSCVTRVDDDPGTDLDERGTCEVVINGLGAGHGALTATWHVEEEVGTTDGTHTAEGTKVYLDVPVAKAPCQGPTPPGARVTYTITVPVEADADSQDAELTNVVVEDHLPDGLTAVAAGRLVGHDPVLVDGVVRWGPIDRLPVGEYRVTLVADIGVDVVDGTTLTNTVTLASDEGTVTATADITASLAGATHRARAYGVHAVALGQPLLGPVPDTDGPDEYPSPVREVRDLLLTVGGEGGSLLGGAPLLGGGEDLFLEHDRELGRIGILRVTEGPGGVDATGADDVALARAADVDLDLGGLVITADAVVAKSASAATGASAGSTAGGSAVLGLVVNGISHGNVTEPTTIAVRNPLTQDLLAEIHVLEVVPSGAAAGTQQPDDGLFESALVVRGLRITLHDEGLIDGLNGFTELVVSHAESAAAFPSALGCGAQAPRLTANAFDLRLDVDSALGDGSPTAEASTLLGNVSLPANGGDESFTSTLVAPESGPLVEHALAHSRVHGSVDLDDDGPDAHAIARLEDLVLFGGELTAELLRATTDSLVDDSTGGASIAGLVIGGVDLCSALVDPITTTAVAGGACTPEPNTDVVLPALGLVVRLNEQVAEGSGLRVNAVHVWVVGEDNPLDLPVGAELVLASAASAAEAGDPGEASTDDLQSLIANHTDLSPALGAWPGVAALLLALAALGLRHHAGRRLRPAMAISRRVRERG